LTSLFVTADIKTQSVGRPNRHFMVLQDFQPRKVKGLPGRCYSSSAAIPKAAHFVCFPPSNRIYDLYEIEISEFDTLSVWTCFVWPSGLI